MEQSYDAIRQLLEALGQSEGVPVLKGARQWLTSPDRPVRSPAAEDIVERILSEPSNDLYVVSIGSATNIASALVLEPRLASRANVVWLGGTPHHFPSADEFNLRQDPVAARALFDSGVRLMHVPAPGVAENLRTTRAELDARLGSDSALGAHLLELIAERTTGDHPPQRTSRTQAVWDLAAIAWLVNPGWVQSMPVESPLLSDDMKWRQGPDRHRIRVAIRVLRDEVFSDFFRKAEDIRP